jgi:hypothetical protein
VITIRKKNNFRLSGVPAYQVCFGCRYLRPTALPYPQGRRLEANHIPFNEHSFHQPTDIGLALGMAFGRVMAPRMDPAFPLPDPPNHFVALALTGSLSSPIFRDGRAMRFCIDGHAP